MRQRAFLARPRRGRDAWLGLLALLVLAGPAAAQEEATVTVAIGKSTLVESPVPLRRVSIAESEIAAAVVVSPTEVLVNGETVGTTSLLMWGADGSRRFYTVEVTVDAATLQRNLRALFPAEDILVSANRDAYILSGSVSEESIARRAIAIAEATGSPVVNNMQVPAPRQILLQVRIAEVSRTALQELSLNLLRLDPRNIRNDDEGFLGTNRNTPPSGNFVNDPVGADETFSDAVNFWLFHEGTSLSAFVRALRAKGLFRSLAEPNLIALDGKEASFLAGGEFPFPVVQAGATSTSITIQFKEFGVRLRFLPVITNSGNVNLTVAPEVSSLDFANGLQIAGFQIPSLLSRRAETTVELRDGQTFAIAGLIDHSLADNVDRVPILGDIPVLGLLFRSKEARQSRTELLVLVTPHLVEPSDTPPPVPSGEPEDWGLPNSIEEPLEGAPAPGGR